MLPSDSLRNKGRRRLASGTGAAVRPHRIRVIPADSGTGPASSLRCRFEAGWIPSESILLQKRPRRFAGRDGSAARCCDDKSMHGGGAVRELSPQAPTILGTSYRALRYRIRKLGIA